MQPSASLWPAWSGSAPVAKTLAIRKHSDRLAAPHWVAWPARRSAAARVSLRRLRSADQLYAERTADQALETNPTGQSSTWNNPDSGNSGTITPTRTSYTDSGQPCREYQQTATIGGETQQAYGTACRQADGSWRIAN